MEKSITPSLTHNNLKAVPSSWSIGATLCIGMAIQILVIIINALVVYRRKYLRAGYLIASWGYPVWLAGTVAINIGTSICAYVVIGRTTIFDVKPHTGNTHLQIFRVQKALDTEHLPAFMIQHNTANPTMKWAKTHDTEQPWWAGVGAFFALGGFVCQNIGTR
jgi:hypothetical protein